jgi:hypothetical protein
MADLSHLLAMPIKTRREAEAFIEALCALGLDYHFDDGADDCLHRNGLVTEEEAEQIDDRVKACYAAWQASGADLYHDCPIGHMLIIFERQEAANGEQA